jgi:hypothetical protein
MKYVLLLLILISSAYGQAPSRTYEQFVPMGAMMDFPFANCPSGWIKMNGASVLKTRIPKLAAAMGNSHGNGTTNPVGATADVGCPHATNCVNLPDFRGRFRRMIDDGSGRDVDGASRTAMAIGGNAGNLVGSVQEDAIRNITGMFGRVRVQLNAIWTASGVFYGVSNVVSGDANGGSAVTTDFYFDASRVVPTGSDNRPKSGSVISCIKL